MKRKEESKPVGRQKAQRGQQVEKGRGKGQVQVKRENKKPTTCRKDAGINLADQTS